jgi:hypothetical protein
VTLTGTRTVVTTGQPRKTPAAGTYRVTETDTIPGVRSLAFAGSARNTVRRVFYDGDGTTLCRIERVAVAYANVTTGVRTGESIDTIVVSRAGGALR